MMDRGIPPTGTMDSTTRNQDRIIDIVTGDTLVQSHYIALGVLREVVIGPGGSGAGLVANTHGTVILVEIIPQGVLLRSAAVEALLCHCQTIYNVVLRIPAIGVGFSRPQAVGIVRIAVGLSFNRQLRQFSAVDPLDATPTTPGAICSPLPTPSVQPASPSEIPSAIAAITTIRIPVSTTCKADTTTQQSADSSTQTVWPAQDKACWATICLRIVIIILLVM